MPLSVGAAVTAGQGRERAHVEPRDGADVVRRAVDRDVALRAERPLETQAVLVVQTDLGDQHLDEDLLRGAVELPDRVLDERPVARERRDDQRVVRLVGDDLDLPLHDARLDVAARGDHADDGRGRRGRGGAARSLNGSRVTLGPGRAFAGLAEDLGQSGGELLGLDVLHVVDEDALVGLRVHVELGAPAWPRARPRRAVRTPNSALVRLSAMIRGGRSPESPPLGRAGQRGCRAGARRRRGRRHRHGDRRGAGAPAAEELIEHPPQLHRVGEPDRDQPEIVGRDLHVEHAQDL